MKHFIDLTFMANLFVLNYHGKYGLYILCGTIALINVTMKDVSSFFIKVLRMCT